MCVLASIMLAVRSVLTKTLKVPGLTRWNNNTPFKKQENVLIIGNQK